MLILMQPLTWFHFLWTKYRGVEEPRNPFLRRVYDTSANIIRSAKIRAGIYLVISVSLGLISALNVIGCDEVEEENSGSTELMLTNCVSSWVINLNFNRLIAIRQAGHCVSHCNGNQALILLLGNYV